MEITEIWYGRGEGKEIKSDVNNGFFGRWFRTTRNNASGSREVPEIQEPFFNVLRLHMLNKISSERRVDGSTVTHFFIFVFSVSFRRKE